MKEKITGIILAGGKSLRMGVDKAFIQFKNKILIEHILDVSKNIFQEILISANDEKYLQFGLPLIPDIIPNHGPIGGIYSCLEASSNNFNIVLSCDTPFISEELICFIIENIEKKQIVVPATENNLYEPLCAFYHKNTGPILREFIDRDNNRIPDVFKVVDFKGLPVNSTCDFWHPNLFANINSLTEFEKYSLIKNHNYGNL